MVSLVFTKPIARRLNFSRFTPNGFKLYSTKVSKPLRILFCGSDEFSIASLQAIHAAHQRNPDFIKSIDVFCRPGKRAGRSLKKIREGNGNFQSYELALMFVVPIKAVAQELGLTLHERDTFTGWPVSTSNTIMFHALIVPSCQNQKMSLSISLWLSHLVSSCLCEF